MSKTQMPSTLPAMVGLLLVCSLLSGGLLAITKAVTADGIAAADLAKQKSALATVLPGFDNDPFASARNSGKEAGASIYTLKQGETVIGYAVACSSNKGYGGTISATVGIDLAGTLRGIAITTMAETPGLGTKLKNAAFQAQFLGKAKPDGGYTVKKDGGTVDAISAATISSRAFCDLLNRAFLVYEELGHE